ncbi:MAG: peptidase T [Oscillospiraceae bacterium]|nr:peptidase T [Oscillospiraceae bacterium]
MSALDRFLRYVSFHTTSDESSEAVPSAPRELELARQLKQELLELGVADAVVDDFGRVYGHLPASPGREGEPTLGLIAHMDTAPDASGEHVKPRRVRYTGGDLVLNGELGVVMSPEELPALANYVNRELIVTDGTTLLGADDKAGVAEIMATVEHFVAHPEQGHPRLAVAFTPDEEIGRGADHFDYARFGAEYAYTVDGGALGEVEYENFNAANAGVKIHGRNIHPGSAKNIMKNAALMAVEFISLLPAAETPAHTEGYEGFYHVNYVNSVETEGYINLIVRDHDRASFEARKDFLRRTVDYLNGKYGDGTFELILRDSYYNMREKLAEHMYLIDWAKDAFCACGVEPRVQPVRGGTDGARLSWEGLPCPNLSTGGENFHGIYEFIPVDALDTMTRVLVTLVSGRGNG